MQTSNLVLLLLHLVSFIFHVMIAELTLIPSATLHPGSISMYNVPHWDPGKPNQYIYSGDGEQIKIKHEHLLHSARAAAGNVSVIAKRKLTRSIDYFLFITNTNKVQQTYTGTAYKFKLAFVTLTLPSKQIHSDNEIKSQCLNQLLIEIKRWYSVKHYIWRAEKQKNGNIHFHLLVDKFIPFQELRDRWNRIINKLGYVDRYREEQQNFHNSGFKIRTELLRTWSLKAQYTAYLRGNKIHWNSPNSTDIHSVRGIFNMKLYLCKYLTKNEITQKINENSSIDISEQEGRIWSADKDLMNLKGSRFIVDSKVQIEIENLLKQPGVKILHSEYFSTAFFDMNYIMNFPKTELYKFFCEYLFSQFKYNFQLQIN